MRLERKLITLAGGLSNSPEAAKKACQVLARISLLDILRCDEGGVEVIEVCCARPCLQYILKGSPLLTNGVGEQSLVRIDSAGMETTGKEAVKKV